jgi:hypothetical protein
MVFQEFTDGSCELITKRSYEEEALKTSLDMLKMEDLPFITAGDPNEDHILLSQVTRDLINDEGYFDIRLYIQQYGIQTPVYVPLLK